MAKITVFAEIIFASKNVQFWVPKWSQNGGWRRPRASKDGSEEAPKRKNIFSEKSIFGEKSGKRKLDPGGAKKVVQGGISISGGAATGRARATGKGREGVNPSPGTGDWEFFAKRIFSTRLEAQGLGGLKR